MRWQARPVCVKSAKTQQRFTRSAHKISSMLLGSSAATAAALLLFDYFEPFLANTYIGYALLHILSADCTHVMAVSQRRRRPALDSFSPSGVMGTRRHCENTTSFRNEQYVGTAPIAFLLTSQPSFSAVSHFDSII